MVGGGFWNNGIPEVPTFVRSQANSLREAGRIGLWAARQATALIGKSRNLLEVLPPKLRASATVLPNGVNTSLFAPMPKDDCRIKLS
jgi:hypothetical protein